MRNGSVDVRMAGRVGVEELHCRRGRVVLFFPLKLREGRDVNSGVELTDGLVARDAEGGEWEGIEGSGREAEGTSREARDS
jgi:hypothetical protein